MTVNIHDWGIAGIIQLQSALAEWAIGPLNFFTFLGYEEWFLLMIPFIFWCIDARLGLQLSVYLTLTAMLTSSLKVVFSDPRPYWVDPRVMLLTESETSFGIPSGHASIGVVIWGALAAYIRKPWAWLAAMLTAVLIGVSRIALGVHFPTDVLAGWLLGAVLLSLYMIYKDTVLALYNRHAFPIQVAGILAVSLTLIGVGMAENSLVEGRFAVPGEWAETARTAGQEDDIAPFARSGYTTNAAVLFGSVVGYTWLVGRGGFSSGGAWTRRILRYTAGMAVAVAIWAGLDALFAQIAGDESLAGYILRFIRYGLIGIWIGGVAPRLFIRLGWADRGERA